MKFQKILNILIAVLLISGCTPKSMPKKLEYVAASNSGGNAVHIIDKRPEEDKSFREIINTDVSYYYGDESFNNSLIEIMSDRLNSAIALSSGPTSITIKKIVLAASINGANIDEQRFKQASNPAIYGGGADVVIAGIIARPIITSIETATSYRSVWCRIDYVVRGEEHSERAVSAAKADGLKNEIVSLYLKTIDRVAEKIGEQ
jgi:hypothetical protein